MCYTCTNVCICSLPGTVNRITRSFLFSISFASLVWITFLFHTCMLNAHEETSIKISTSVDIKRYIH